MQVNNNLESAQYSRFLNKPFKEMLSEDFKRLHDEYVSAATDKNRDSAAQPADDHSIGAPVSLEVEETAPVEDISNVEEFEASGYPEADTDDLLEDVTLEEVQERIDALEEVLVQDIEEPVSPVVEEIVEESPVEAEEIPEVADSVEEDAPADSHVEDVPVEVEEPQLEVAEEAVEEVPSAVNSELLDELLETDYSIETQPDFFAEDEAPAEDVFANPDELVEETPVEPHLTLQETITEHSNERILNDIIDDEDDVNVAEGIAHIEDDEDELQLGEAQELDDDDEIHAELVEEPVTPAPQTTERVVEREIIREVVVLARGQAQEYGYVREGGAVPVVDPNLPAVAPYPVSVQPAQPVEVTPVTVVDFDKLETVDDELASRVLSRGEEDEKRFAAAKAKISAEEQARVKAEAERKAREQFANDNKKVAEKKPRGSLFGFGRKKVAEEPAEPVVQPLSISTEEPEETVEHVDPTPTGSTKKVDDKKAQKKSGGLFSRGSEPAYVPLEGEVDPQTWLESTIRAALKEGASDLHISIKGDSKDLTARIRVDGAMKDYATVTGPPARIIMGRLKAATELSSAGSFAPEETIYTIEIDGEQRKARAVIFRTEDDGEALVMRLPLTGRLKELHELNFSEKNLELVYNLLSSPSKLIMIAGPMGSGKTTTAHGAMLHVATAERTVWTIEDPVERKLPQTVQLEIDEENGAGFDVLLSKLLRADYNTLFLGEIRDHATAAAAVRQAKAGRQVMSTIHANNNVTALLRLIELAADSPLSVLDSVRGVISQRLVRRLNTEWDGVDPKKKYAGRLPIHEVLIINDNLIEVMMQNRPLTEIKAAAETAEGSTFAEDCERLLQEGLTDEEEIRRVIGDNR